MKITKTHLSRIIQEELAKSIEEAEGAKGVTYWPFVGGKIDKEDIQMAKETISDYTKQYDDVYGVTNWNERARIQDDLDEMEKLLKSMSKRHKKSDFDKADKAWRSLDASLRNALGDAKRAHKKQRNDIGDANLARIDRENERERQADRNRDDRYRAQRQQEKEKMDRQYGSSGRDDYHRVNPGFAGTGNMGYGESLDRTKITKSALARIIQEELSAVTAEGYGNYKRDDKKPRRGKKGLGEGGYDDEYDYGADERAEEEYFSQALWDAVDGALEDWNGTPAPKHEIITGAPEGIDELDWDEMGEKYLSSLIDDGTVELRQGAPGDDWNGEEELYVLALR